MHGVGLPMNQTVGVPGVGMQMAVPGTMMQQPSPQQMQPQPPQAEKSDNISKVKSLIGPLRETLTATLKSAAQVLHQNYHIDAGSQKPVDNAVPRFDKNLEEFYSMCDQIELHLKTSLTCIQQAQSATHYLPLQVQPTRMDPPLATPTQDPSALSYPQYLSTVRAQVAYAKEIHDTLVAAAQNISPTE